MHKQMCTIILRTAAAEEQMMGHLMKPFKQKQKTKTQVSCVSYTHFNVLEHNAPEEVIVYLLTGQEKYH